MKCFFTPSKLISTHKNYVNINAKVAIVTGLTFFGINGGLMPSEAVQLAGTAPLVTEKMSESPRLKVRSKYRPRAYSVEFTSPPSMQPRSYKGETSLLQRLSNARILLIGLDPERTKSVNFAETLLERLVDTAKGQTKEVLLSLDHSMPQRLLKPSKQQPEE